MEMNDRKELICDNGKELSVLFSWPRLTVILNLCIREIFHRSMYVRSVIANIWFYGFPDVFKAIYMTVFSVTLNLK